MRPWIFEWSGNTGIGGWIAASIWNDEQKSLWCSLNVGLATLPQVSWRWVPCWGAALIMICLGGCRTLRDNRQAKQLTSARQISLRGAEALQQQKWSDAESLFAEALERSNADERAQWGYAEVLWRRGQFQQATEHMLRAVETSRGDPDYAVRLGQMYFEQKELPKAMEQAEVALRQHRNHAGAWALLGDIQREHRNLQAALDCYSKSLIFKNDAPAVQVSLAEVYREMGRPQRALATLTSLEHDLPEDKVPPKAWLLKGLAYADLGENSNAKKYFSLTAQRAGDSTELMLQLAQAQYQAGDLAEARLCLGQVLSRDSKNEAALSLQANLDQLFASMPSNGSNTEAAVAFEGSPSFQNMPGGNGVKAMQVSQPSSDRRQPQPKQSSTSQGMFVIP